MHCCTFPTDGKEEHTHAHAHVRWHCTGGVVLRTVLGTRSALGDAPFAHIFLVYCVWVLRAAPLHRLDSEQCFTHLPKLCESLVQCYSSQRPELAANASKTHTTHQNGLQATSGFEMCFAIGSQLLGRRVPTLPTKTRLDSRKRSLDNIFFISLLFNDWGCRPRRASAPC